MVICFAISMFYYMRSLSTKMITWLLFISILTEIIVEICKHTGRKYYILYHFFTPIEYLFIGLYFYHSVKNKTFKSFCLSSIIFFLLICTISIFLNYKLESFPRFISYLECFFLLILSTLSLLFLDPNTDKAIYKVSDFWFSIAFLLFNSSLFIVLFFNQNDKVIKEIFSLINLSFNCLLYFLLIVGFLCLKTKRNIFYWLS